jgi:hypothetical protein
MTVLLQSVSSVDDLHPLFGFHAPQARQATAPYMGIVRRSRVPRVGSRHPAISFRGGRSVDERTWDSGPAQPTGEPYG